MKNQICSLVGVLGLLGGPMTATAKTIIAFEFVGQVTHVEFELDGQFAAGDIFSGIYRFDSELHDLFAEPERGFYEPLGFGHVTVESGRPDVPNYLALMRDGHGDILVGNEAFRRDSYVVETGGFRECREISGPSVGGFRLCGFRLELADTDALVFDSDALPLTPPDLEQFEIASFVLEFRGIDEPVDGAWLFGSISSISLFSVTVPEPGTLALLGLGLLGLGVTRRSL